MNGIGIVPYPCMSARLPGPSTVARRIEQNTRIPPVAPIAENARCRPAPRERERYDARGLFERTSTTKISGTSPWISRCSSRRLPDRTVRQRIASRKPSTGACATCCWTGTSRPARGSRRRACSRPSWASRAIPRSMRTSVLPRKASWRPRATARSRYGTDATARTSERKTAPRRFTCRRACTGWRTPTPSPNACCRSFPACRPSTNSRLPSGVVASSARGRPSRPPGWRTARSKGCPNCGARWPRTSACRAACAATRARCSSPTARRAASNSARACWRIRGNTAGSRTLATTAREPRSGRPA